MPGRRIVPVAATALVVLGVALSISVSQAADPVVPKGYIVAEINVADPEGYQLYAAKAGPIVAQYGGRYLARGGRTIAIEGQPPEKRIAVVEFDSLDAALRFAQSPEYAEAAKIRRRYSTGRFYAVEGLPPAP